MAAKAEPESTGDEIWFNDAVMLLADRCGEAADFAQQRLVEGLKSGLPYTRLDGTTRVRGDKAFWNWKGRTATRLTIIRNRAFYSVLLDEADMSDVPDPVIAIKVSRSAALALVGVTEQVLSPAASAVLDATEAPDVAAFVAQQIASGELAATEVPDSAPAAEQYNARPQLKRTIQSLRRIFPPDGKVPVGMTVKTVRGRLDADLAEENRNLGKATPGWDIVKKAIAILGRRGD